VLFKVSWTERVREVEVEVEMEDKAVVEEVEGVEEERQRPMCITNDGRR